MAEWFRLPLCGVDYELLVRILIGASEDFPPFLVQRNNPAVLNTGGSSLRRRRVIPTTCAHPVQREQGHKNDL